MSFKFYKLEIPEVILIEPTIYNDKRGFFMEVYKFSDFNNAGIREYFKQINRSSSEKGVLRGLHYQLKPKAQGKLVNVLKGKILDVAVDIRKKSPSYGRWVARELSDENKCLLWVPPFCAHGFFVLEDNTEVMYQSSDEYAPAFERGITWDDPEIGIKWPSEKPIISEKDAMLPRMSKAENNFIYGEEI